MHRFRELEVELVGRRRADAPPAREGAAEGRAPRRRAAPEALPRARARPGRRAGGEARRPAVGRARARARAAGAPILDPRPGHAARLRAGGPPPDARRDAPAARVPQGRGAAPRPRAGRSRCARSSRGSAARSGRRATSTCSSRTSRERSRRSVTTRRRAAGILDGLEGERARARGAVVEALSSDRYLALLDRLEHVGSPGSRGRRPPLARSAGEAWKRARRKLERLDASSTDEELHRRASSSSAPATRPSSPRTSWASGDAVRGSRRRSMQDVLGVHQDAVVAEERIRAWAEQRAARAASAPGCSCSASATARRPPAALAGRLEEAPPGGEAGRMSVVRAAGGVPVRAGADGLEVLVVHRPAYDDWTFPKGKCEPGESDEACALREVEEETGLRCALGDELPSTAYIDASRAATRRALLAAARRGRRAGLRARGRRGALGDARRRREALAHVPARPRRAPGGAAPAPRRREGGDSAAAVALPVR